MQPKQLLLFVFVCLMAGFSVSAWYWGQQPVAPLNPQDYKVMSVLSSPRALEGFSLQSYSQQTRKTQPYDLTQLQGRWTLMFFGYTHCPDVCPTTLASLKQVFAKLSPEQQSKLQVVLVSIDPARDTPEKLATYTHYFNPQFFFFFGTEAELQKLTRALGAVYTKVGEGERYDMDHVSRLFLFSPAAQQVASVAQPFAADALAAELATLLD